VASSPSDGEDDVDPTPIFLTIAVVLLRLGHLAQTHLQIVHLLLNLCEFFDNCVEDSKGRQFRFRFFPFKEEL
jgi:hypothetical protein